LISLTLYAGVSAEEEPIGIFAAEGEGIAYKNGEFVYAPGPAAAAAYPGDRPAGFKE